MNEIKSESYDEFVKDTCVVLFGAPWCGPCKQLTPVLEKFSKEYSKVHFGKVNIEDEYNLAERFRIKSVPTMMFYENGEVVQTMVGSQQPAKIQQAIEMISA